ncbi:hypothetical protein CMI37_12150 [Candidatus Pacearchaeota archaeon]|nr:hypothetical protein [Candidatus Pacearchaeota archaeon]|tara:strand:+ start:11139 stop:11396 length:258 start_codon:yes stop_codon:yes gene_type:complete
MVRLIKTTVKNPGGFSVRVEPNATDPAGKPRYVELSHEPAELDDADAQHILNTYPGKVEEIIVEVEVEAKPKRRRPKLFKPRKKT